MTQQPIFIPNPKIKLLDQVREVIRFKHLSIRTEEAYVHWIQHFIFFHQKRHPKDMGAPEIEAFLTHLAVARNVAASTRNQALNALVFLHRHVLRFDPGQFGPIERAKRPVKLPVVLRHSRDAKTRARSQEPAGCVSRGAAFCQKSVEKARG